MIGLKLNKPWEYWRTCLMVHIKSDYWNVPSEIALSQERACCRHTHIYGELLYADTCVQQGWRNFQHHCFSTFSRIMLRWNHVEIDRCIIMYTFWLKAVKKVLLLHIWVFCFMECRTAKHSSLLWASVCTYLPSNFICNFVCILNIVIQHASI